MEPAAVHYIDFFFYLQFIYDIKKIITPWFAQNHLDHGFNWYAAINYVIELSLTLRVIIMNVNVYEYDLSDQVKGFESICLIEMLHAESRLTFLVWQCLEMALKNRPKTNIALVMLNITALYHAAVKHKK